MAMQKLLRHIQSSIPGKRLGVAVSGGADSVALLRLLCRVQPQSPLDLTVLHVDHSLRPDSAEDAQWVQRLAESLGLPFYSIRIPRPTSRELRANGVEAWARKKRLSAFALLAEQHSLEAVCLGHHAQDQAETILWRLLRGASLQGLGGLHPLKNLAIDGRPLLLWRPLLKTSPEELRTFLRKIGQDWREDPTNRDMGFLRNRIRYELLPIMEQLRSKSVAHLCRAAEDIRLAQGLLRDKARGFLRASKPGLLPLPRRLPPLALVKEILRQWWIGESGDRSDRFDRAFLDRLLDLVQQNRCGRRIEMPAKRWSEPGTAFCFSLPKLSMNRSKPTLPPERPSDTETTNSSANSRQTQKRTRVSGCLPTGFQLLDGEPGKPAIIFGRPPEEGGKNSTAG